MRGKRRVKTRTLENREGAAPKFILAPQGFATPHLAKTIEEERAHVQNRRVGHPAVETAKDASVESPIQNQSHNHEDPYKE